MSAFKQFTKDEKKKLVGMVYGSPGNGKTSLLTSLHHNEQFGKVALVDADHGTGSVVAEGVLVTEPVWTLQEAYKCYKELAAGIEGVNTVIVDSLSAINELSLDLQSQEPDQFMQVGKTNRLVWTQRNRQVFKIFKKFTTLPYDNILFIAGEMSVGPDDGPKVVKPAFSESLSDKITHYLDFVFRMQVKGKGRALQVARSATVYAKNRTPGLEKEIGRVLDIGDEETAPQRFIELLEKL